MTKEYAGWRRFHEETKVEHPTLGWVLIDAGIADLMAALWAAGIDTVNSCEAHVNGLVYVVLADLTDLDRLLSSVSLGTLAVAVMNDDVGAPDSSLEESWRWRYRLRPVNPNGPGRWRFMVSVEFRPADIPEVIRCLSSYAQEASHGG